MKSDILFDIDYKRNNGLEEEPDTMTSGRVIEIKKHHDPGTAWYILLDDHSEFYPALTLQRIKYVILVLAGQFVCIRSTPGTCVNLTWVY